VDTRLAPPRPRIRLCSETVPAEGQAPASAIYPLRELGRHSVCARAGAQSVETFRLLVARLDARSTSMNQSEASCQNKLELNDLPSVSSVWQDYSTSCKLPNRKRIVSLFKSFNIKNNSRLDLPPGRIVVADGQKLARSAA